MKKKKKKIIKNFLFLTFIFMFPIMVKVLKLDPLELTAVILAIKGINEIYSNFKIGIILRKKFGYYH